ncbi:MAG: hypothetical protein LBH74_02960 [Nitrososphaerota archaeon]|nr:hypothetical protein [Nitrososphaerota archaeon]
MKFKAEVILLVIAIVLFAVSMFCYSYPNTTPGTKTLSLSSVYPYRSIAVVFVGIASISMVTASLSYSKKTKTTIH